MLISPDDAQLKSLAQAVADGQPVRAWANQQACDAATADEWCRLPEFQRLVDGCRVQAADQMVGRLMNRSTAAVEQITAASRYSPNATFRLSAGRVLMDKWLGVSSRFEQTRQIAELKTLMDSWEKKVDGGS